MATELEKSNGVTHPLVLLQSMIEKGGDPAALEKMMALAERWQANQDAAAYALAVRDFQTLMPAIEKNRDVPNKDGSIRYRFADFDAIMETAQPLLNQCGITVTFDTEGHGPEAKMICFTQVGSHVRRVSVPMPTPDIPAANASQKAGGALKYGMRYALCAALNIRIKGEDNDAQGLDEMLSEAQQHELTALIDECKAAGNAVDIRRFLAVFSVETLADVKAEQFTQAVQMLNAKRRQKVEAKS